MGVGGLNYKSINFPFPLPSFQCFFLSYWRQLLSNIFYFSLGYRLLTNDILPVLAHFSQDSIPLHLIDNIIQDSAFRSLNKNDRNIITCLSQFIALKALLSALFVQQSFSLGGVNFQVCRRRSLSIYLSCDLSKTLTGEPINSSWSRIVFHGFIRVLSSDIDLWSEKCIHR